jgi:hypothetical protein
MMTMRGAIRSQTVLKYVSRTRETAIAIQRKRGRPRTPKEEQDSAIEQDKRGEDEEVLYVNGDEVRDAASYHRQDATEEAGEKTESEESRPGQMAVHPPHAQKGDRVHQGQQSLTGEERSIIHPRKPHYLVRSTGAGAKK